VFKLDNLGQLNYEAEAVVKPSGRTFLKLYELIKQSQADNPAFQLGGELMKETAAYHSAVTWLNNILVAELWL